MTMAMTFPMRPQSAQPPWKLLAALCFTTAVNTGFTYFGGSIMNSHMAAELQLDRQSLGLAFGAFGLCLGLSLPLVAFCVSRWGARRTLLAGSLMTTLGALAMGLWVSSMAGVLLAYGLLLGIGASLGGLLPAETMVAHGFHQGLARAVTIMLSGTALGGILAAPLFETVISAWDGNWRAGWLALAASSLIALLVMVRWVHLADSSPAPSASVEPLADTPRAKPGVYKTDAEWTARAALAQPAWWLLALATIFSLATFGMMVGHGVVHFIDLGHDPARAALFLACLPLTGFAGKLLVGTLGDRVEPRLIWAGAMVLMALGMALAVKASSSLDLYAAAFLLGAGDSAAYPCMVTLLVNYFGKTAYAALMGLMLLIGSLAAAMGSILAGLVFDHFGSYGPAFYPTAACCLVVGLLLPLIKPPLVKPPLPPQPPSHIKERMP